MELPLSPPDIRAQVRPQLQYTVIRAVCKTNPISVRPHHHNTSLAFIHFSCATHTAGRWAVEFCKWCWEKAARKGQRTPAFCFRCDPRTRLQKQSRWVDGSVVINVFCKSAGLLLLRSLQFLYKIIEKTYLHSSRARGPITLSNSNTGTISPKMILRGTGRHFNFHGGCFIRANLISKWKNWKDRISTGIVIGGKAFLFCLEITAGLSLNWSSC